MNAAGTTLSVLKTLADGVRLDIVRTLHSQPDGVSQGCDISQLCYQRFNVSQPTMSHHLARLVEAGVLLETKEGTSKRYQLDRQHLLSLGIDVSKL